MTVGGAGAPRGHSPPMVSLALSGAQALLDRRVCVSWAGSGSLNRRPWSVCSAKSGPGLGRVQPRVRPWSQPADSARAVSAPTPTAPPEASSCCLTMLTRETLCLGHEGVLSVLLTPQDTGIGTRACPRSRGAGSLPGTGCRPPLSGLRGHL